MTHKTDKIEVSNVNTPGRTVRLDRDKFEDMRDALLQVLPLGAPGLSAAEAVEAVKPLLDQSLFPEGAKAMWWLKSVQLDLEEKGQIARENTKPMRLHKV